MTAYSYSYWPQQFGVNIVTQLSPDNLYIVPRSQTAVFPFKLGDYKAVQIDTTHTSFYNNQACTIASWCSQSINGSSITISPNPNLARIQIGADGFRWMFYAFGLDPNLITRPIGLQSPELTQWIYPDTQYYMMFQNLENKDNGFYARFTYIT